MPFPLFRNGKLLFCRDQSGKLGLATSCCSWKIQIDVPGWNSPDRFSPEVRFFKATQLFDSADNLVGGSGDSWTQTVTSATSWRVGLKVKAWQAQYDSDYSTSNISWTVRASIPGTHYSSALSGNMGGTTTDDVTTGNDTTGGLSIYVSFDPSDGIHLTVSRTAPPSRSSMLASLEQEMENS